MARVKFSPIVTDIAGSIGGITFQRNKFGNTMRQKPLPLNPASDAQYNVRQKIAAIQAAWRALSDADRLQWDRFLSFSNQNIRRDRSVKMSGHALYLKYQLLRSMQNIALLTDIAYIPMPDVPAFLKFEFHSPITRIYFDATVDDNNYFFNLRMSRPRLSSSRFSQKGLRYMYVDKASEPYFSLEFSYPQYFGIDLAVGDHVHYSLQFFALLSPVFLGSVTGSATVI